MRHATNNMPLLKGRPPAVAGSTLEKPVGNLHRQHARTQQRKRLHEPPPDGATRCQHSLQDSAHGGRLAVSVRPSSIFLGCYNSTAMAFRMGMTRSEEEAGLAMLREAVAHDTRWVRRTDRRRQADEVANELAGVLRGAALDPRQDGVVREEDIRSLMPPREPTPPRTRVRPSPAAKSEEHERVAAARRRNALASIRDMFHGMDEKSSKHVLDPDSRLARALHWTTFGCCLHTVFAEPYLLAMEQFATDKQGNVPGLLVGLSVACEIFFLLDMIGGPLKGYFWLAPGGAGWKKEMHLERTSLNYLRTSFALDFVSRICPVQLVVFATSHSFESIDALFVLSILKLLSIRRVWGVLTSFVDGDIRWYRSVGLAKAGLLWLISVHWLACMWLIALVRSTIGHESASEAAAGVFIDSCSERAALVVNNTLTGQYICAYYRVAQTLTTTTFGDIPATGFADRAITMGCMYLGATVVYLSFVRSFGSAGASEELQFIHQRNAIVDSMQRRSLAVELLDDTKSFYQHRWNSSRGFIDLLQIRMLPTALRVQAFHHLCSEITEHISFLHVRPPEDVFFWNFLIERMHHETYMPGDTIRRCDDPAHYDAIFIMLRGSVDEVHEETGYVYRRHRGPCWFGEVEELSGRKRAAAIRAVEICDLLELDLALIRSILNMPTMRDVRKVLQDCCQARINKPGVARWKFYWGKHKKALLSMAKSMATPAPPWPRALLEYDMNLPAHAPDTSSEWGSFARAKTWQDGGGSSQDALAGLSDHSQVVMEQDFPSDHSPIRGAHSLDPDAFWPDDDLPNVPVSDSGGRHGGMDRSRRPPDAVISNPDTSASLGARAPGGLDSRGDLHRLTHQGVLEMGWR